MVDVCENHDYIKEYNIHICNIPR